MAVSDPIRPIVQRLNATPVHDLPRYAIFLASSILNGAKFIQHVNDQQGEGSVQLHKLTTRVTSLLQDKTQEGRFTGIVLVKALVEAGDVQRLTTSGLIWLRALLSCVNKQDPPEVKKLAIYTITRIFLLTKSHQSLIRELTTPNLPSFINGCLNSIRPLATSHGGSTFHFPSPLLESVFQCWLQLLDAFPSTFRPFVASIRTILLTTLSDQTASSALLNTAMQTCTKLHFCATKDSVASEWNQTCQHTIQAAHQVADSLFRSVIEDWSANGSYQPSTAAARKVTGQVKAQTSDAAGLSKWSGFQAGCSRSIVLVDLLARLLTGPHAQAVRLPLAEVLDLTARFAAIVTPTKTYGLRENKEISRDERDELFMSLPSIHCAVLDLQTLLMATFCQLMTPVLPIILAQIWEIFDSEQTNQKVRSAVYSAMTEFLKHGATCLGSGDSQRLATLIELCCDDLGSYSGELRNHSVHTTTQSSDLTLSAGQQFLAKNAMVHQIALPELIQAAWDLMPVILSRVPQSLISSKTRANIDRSVIISGHQEAMLASVLSPLPIRRGAGYAPSILPILARSCQQHLAFEALIRPRQPTVPIPGLFITEDDGQQTELTSLQEAAPSDFVSGQVESNEGDLINTPSAQLDGELASEISHDKPAVKKRDYEGSTEVTRPDPEAPFKKPKVHQEFSEASTHRTVADVSPSIPENLVESLQRTENDVQIPENVFIVQQYEKEGARGLQAQVPVTQNPKQLPTTDQDDDSDDSEIPQIDVTLTSDDDDMDE